MKKQYGVSSTKIYHKWAGMKERCYNKNAPQYKNYGGRGIRVCDEWFNSFTAFRDWAFANGYDDKLSLDRIDVNGNYCPENCRWATQNQQANNKRNTIRLEYNGETHTISEWAAITGLEPRIIYRRLRSGWSVERIMLTPSDGRNVTINGESHCIADWARIKGVRPGTIYERIRLGWSVEEAITRPVQKQKQITVDEQTYSIDEWAKIVGIPADTIAKRLSAGMTAEEALNKKSRKYITINGETHSVSEWSIIVGKKTATIYNRLASGWSEEDAILAPLAKGKRGRHKIVL